MKNLVSKHWGKLIVVYLLGSFILNFNEAKSGFIDGWNDAKCKRQNK
jgi:hypothetical protein